MLFKYKYNPQTLPVEKLQERIHIVDEQLADPAKVSEIFTKLVQSLRDCCRVKLWYYAANSRQNTERVVEPYGLICKRHNWYLVAFCLKRAAIRVFRVDQITDIFPYTSEHFEMPGDFSLKDHMGPEPLPLIQSAAPCPPSFLIKCGVLISAALLHNSDYLPQIPLFSSIFHALFS